MCIAKISLFLLCKQSTLVTGHLPQFNIRYLECLFSGKTNANSFWKLSTVYCLASSYKISTSNIFVISLEKNPVILITQRVSGEIGTVYFIRSSYSWHPFIVVVLHSYLLTLECTYSIFSLMRNNPIRRRICQRNNVSYVETYLSLNDQNWFMLTKKHKYMQRISFWPHRIKSLTWLTFSQVF